MVAAHQWHTMMMVASMCFSAFAHFTNEYAVEITEGNPKEIAASHQCSHDGHIVDNVHQFTCHSVRKRDIAPHHEMASALSGHPSVGLVEQQKVLSRKKRQLWRIPTQSPPQAHFDNPLHLNDDRWPQMWYLNRGHHLDMNVQQAWQDGYTGKGISVTILDDGIERTNPDLVANYDPLASFDVNQNDNDPTPRYDITDSNKHGTRCAGEVAASANNSNCAVGIAYDASIGGVRMLDGDVTDAVEARSIGLNNQHIDIYSASWGPDDDGKTVDGPGRLATRAFLQGITAGRGGKGSIFVWASGNGGREFDNCNCDGYTNSIWTLSVSSATENGLIPWYSEACSSTLASTYSSGSSGERKVVTTDLHHTCTSSHTGTSASAPLAAGIIAVTLQANPRLNWRDVQHITIRCAHNANLRGTDWAVNGVGRNFSHSFGYGIMDASCMVRHAKQWTEVPEQKKCRVSGRRTNVVVPGRSKGQSTIEVSECKAKYLEHVQAHVFLGASRRGDVKIFLTSPAGTRSTLIAKRPLDNSRAGFNNWPFLTVHMWEESPLGTWTLEVVNDGMSLVELKEWSLGFLGTDVHPQPNMVKNQGRKPPAPVPTATANDVQNATTEVFHLNQAAAAQINENGNPALLNHCAKMASQDWCSECESGFALVHGRCAESCPEEGYFKAETNSREFCSQCYYSCKTCSGTNDYECSSCYGDSQLEEPYAGQRYCRNRSLIGRALSSSKWYNVLSIGFFICFCIILVLIVYIVRWKRSHGNVRSSALVVSEKLAGEKAGAKRKPSALLSKGGNSGNHAIYSPVSLANGHVGDITIPFHDYATSSEDEELLRKPYTDEIKC